MLQVPKAYPKGYSEGSTARLFRVAMRATIRVSCEGFINGKGVKGFGVSVLGFRVLLVKVVLI